MDTIWNRNFVLLSVANLLMATAFYFLLPTLPLYVTGTLHLDKNMVGIILSAYTVAALLIRPFSGVAVDKFGRKSIYLVSFFVFALLFSGYAFAHSFWSMILIRVAHGLAWGVCTTASSTLVVDILPPQKRGEGIGIYGLSMTLAMALGPMIISFASNSGNYQILFFVAVVISFVGWVLVLFVRYPRYFPHESHKKIGLSSLVERKSLPLATNMLFLAITYGGLVAFISLYCKETGVGNAGLFFMVLAIGVSLTRIVSGKVFDLYGPRKILIIGMVFLILGFPLLALIHNLTIYLLSALLLGFGSGIYMPTFQAMVVNLVEPHQRGAANSTLFTMLDLGIGIGMLFTGWFSEQFSISASYLASAVLSIIALILFLGFGSPYYDRQRASFLKEK
jgi:MFS family permease